ncbi:MAG: hypothetical protein U0Q18_25735 [Bryobacteraceae bacterium]
MGILEILCISTFFLRFAVSWTTFTVAGRVRLQARYPGRALVRLFAPADPVMATVPAAHS